MAGFVGGSALSALGAGMVERAERADAERNARRSQGKYGASKEETTPLNPNRNDYEDIENPFRMPIVVSKLDKEFGQECLIKTSVVACVVTMFIGVMLFCTLVFKNIPFLRII